MGKAVVLTLLFCVMFATCKKEQQHAQLTVPVSNVVTGDIKEGIKNHINEQVRQGKGDAVYACNSLVDGICSLSRDPVLDR